MSDDGSEIYAELIYVNADSRDIVNHNISIDVKDLKCTYRMVKIIKQEKPEP